MRSALLLLALLGVSRSDAQDTCKVAPSWDFDLFLGAGSGKAITVRTCRNAAGTIDLAGWFHLGAGVERRIAGRWSGRFAFGYEVGGWEATGTANPFAAPNNSADRWALGAGAVYQLYRGERSQFNLQGGTRLLLGMDVPTTITLDTTTTPSALRDLTLHYRPSVSPVLAVGWRWRPKRGSAGCIGTSLGVSYFHCTYDRVDLPGDVPALPEGLLPLTGAHTGWQALFTLGFSGWV